MSLAPRPSDAELIELARLAVMALAMWGLLDLLGRAERVVRRWLLRRIWRRHGTAWVDRVVARCSRQMREEWARVRAGGRP